ncbi:MAG TPA: hypothetical protein VEY92_08555 [Pseudoxanthomonas sp.]|nr:hypothetical protein [Pseudoxanthomonas sp.]
MRDYGTIHRGFWANESLKALDGDCRLLAAYLLTSPHTNMIGAFRLPDAYACDDLGWDAKRLRNCFETLSQAGFIKYSESAKWVWVIKFLHFNKPANPNMVKAAIKLAEGIPASVPFRSEVLAALCLGEKVSETVSKPLGNTPSPSPSPSPVLEAPAPEEISIPLDDGSDFPVPAELVAEYRSTYRRVDVPGELRKARTWCISNPAQRKTRRGVGKFLNSWLARAEADALKRPPPQSAPEWKPGGGRRELGR